MLEFKGLLFLYLDQNIWHEICRHTGANIQLKKTIFNFIWYDVKLFKNETKKTKVLLLKKFQISKTQKARKTWKARKIL